VDAARALENFSASRRGERSGAVSEVPHVRPARRRSPSLNSWGDQSSPGEGRYAQLEREQRWLLEELPPGITDERVIVDHYWTGTSLRLRMIQNRSEVVYKLCQKVRLDEDNPELVKITNIYLSESEFQVLSVTRASIISKSRWTAVSTACRTPLMSSRVDTRVSCSLRLSCARASLE